MKKRRWHPLALAAWLCAAVAGVCMGCGADSANAELAGGRSNGAPAGADAGATAGEWDSGGGGAAMDAGGGVPDTYIPPEKPVYVPSPPVASKNYVYVLNAQNGTVVRINPADLTIKSIKVGAQPRALLTIPGSDTAVVLNTGSRTITIVRTENNADHVTSVDVGSPYTSMAIAPGGRHVVTYYNTRDLTGTDLIGEEKLAVVDIAPEGGGAPVMAERAVNFRVTDIFFSAGRNEAYVLSKSAVQIIPFGAIDAHQTLGKIPLDAAFITDIPNRTAQVAGDADYIMVRGVTSKELLVVDTRAVDRQHATALLDLGGVPTDLQTTPDATHAIAVLRAESLLKIIPIPTEGFPDPTQVRTVDLAGYTVGTLRIADDRANGLLLGLLYTNAVYDEHVLVIDLNDPARLQYLGNADNLNKAIWNAVVAPGGQSALLIHQRATMSSESDPVERQLDEAEGFSIFQIPSRTFSFTKTAAKPGAFAFSDSGRWCAVTVEAPSTASHQVHLLNMPQATVPRVETFATKSLYVGSLTREDRGGLKEVFYVTQEHNAGRITFITVPATGDGPAEIRTVTGFEINSMGE